jgi:hypothetical protein
MIQLTDLLIASKVAINLDSYKIHLARSDDNVIDSPLAAFFRGVDEFQQWQEYQRRRNFTREMIVSLIELEHQDKWLFVGVYKVLGHEKKSEKHIAYSTELIKGQEDLIGRVVVHHKRVARQSYIYGEKDSVDFEVDSIRTNRLTIEVFPGYGDIQIPYKTLQTIIKQSVPTWRGALLNVRGVYLITDTLTGKLYVGSATGESGIWQRWSSYADNGHGGNKGLLSLLKEKGSDYRDNFQYTVLEIADTYSTDQQILDRESFWKKVLCSRKYGYNEN